MADGARGATRPTYVWVWTGLLILLALNWGLAQLHLGRFNLVVSLLIPLLQMLLMLLYMMHVRHSPPVMKLFVAAGFIWLLIMIDLAMCDYLTRGTEPGGYLKTWQHGAWPAPVKELPPPLPTAPGSNP
jgi:cytochrome c oxidase subunit IV